MPRSKGHVMILNDFSEFVYMGNGHSFLAAAYALEGQSERAAAELAEAQRLGKDNRWSSISRVKVKLLKDYPTEPVYARRECRSNEVG